MTPIILSGPAQQARRDLCMACEHVRLGAIDRCNRCGCAITVKTRVARSECPVGKWGKQ